MEDRLPSLSPEQIQETMHDQIRLVTQTILPKGIEPLSYPSRQKLFSITEDHPAVIYKAASPELLFSQAQPVGTGYAPDVQNTVFEVMRSFGFDENAIAFEKVDEVTPSESKEVRLYAIPGNYAFRRERRFPTANHDKTYEVTWEIVHLGEDSQK